MKKLIFIFLLGSHALGNNIDSLIKEINHTKDIETKLSNYTELVLLYTHIPDSSIYYAKQAKKLAGIKKFTKERAFFNSIIGSIYLDIQSYEKATPYLQEALSLYQQINDSFNIAIIYLNLGIIKMYKVDDLEAIEYFQDAYDLFNKLKEQNQMNEALLNLASLYINRAKSKEAIKLLYRILDSEKEKSTIYYRTCYFLGYCFNRMEVKPDSAKYYLMQALGYAGYYDKYNNYAKIHNELALSFTLKKDYEKAIKHYQEALILFKKTSSQGQGVALSNLSSVFISIHQYDSALYYAQKAVNLFEAKKDRYNLNNGYENLQLAYEKLDDYKNAYRILKLKSENNVYLYQIERDKAFKELEEKFTIEQKEREIQIFRAKYLAERKQKFIISILGILIIAGIIYTYSLRKNAEKAYKKNIHTILEQFVQNDVPKEKADVQHEKAEKKFVDLQVIDEKLTEAMKNQKIYRNQTITLSNLAKDLNTNRAYLSSLINSKYHKNFNTFINEHRIQDSIEMFVQGKHKELTLEAIAGEVGFKNRTTFFMAFKNTLGVSPVHFIKLMEDEIQNKN